MGSRNETPIGTSDLGNNNTISAEGQPEVTSAPVTSHERRQYRHFLKQLHPVRTKSRLSPVDGPTGNSVSSTSVCNGVDHKPTGCNGPTSVVIDNITNSECEGGVEQLNRTKAADKPVDELNPDSPVSIIVTDIDGSQLVLRWDEFGRETEDTLLPDGKITVVLL